MTDSEKKAEIADRLKRLSKLREELAVARSNLDKDLQKVAFAGKFYCDHHPDYPAPPSHDRQPKNRPSSQEVDSNKNTITS